MNSLEANLEKLQQLRLKYADNGIEPRFSPREVERLFQVKRDRQRYWERKKAALPDRDDNGYRYYTLATLEQLLKVPALYKVTWSAALNYENVDPTATNIVYHAVCRGDQYTYHYVGETTAKAGLIGRMRGHHMDGKHALKLESQTFKSESSHFSGYYSNLVRSTAMDILAALSNPDRWTITSIPFTGYIFEAENRAQVMIARKFSEDRMLQEIIEKHYQHDNGISSWDGSAETLRDDLHQLTSSPEVYQRYYQQGSLNPEWRSDFPTFLKRYQQAFMTDIPEIYDYAPNAEILEILKAKNPFAE